MKKQERLEGKYNNSGRTHTLEDANRDRRSKHNLKNSVKNMSRKKQNMTSKKKNKINFEKNKRKKNGENCNKTYKSKSRK